MKASAVAHPIQGLIKYHGLRDSALRLPFHDSISVCTAPLHTLTTVEFSSQYQDDVYTINGEVGLQAYERARIQSVLDRLRLWANTGVRCRLSSRNSFQTNIGLGASASAFASITLAAAAALRLELDTSALSRVARLGAGSACRALVGGFARWAAGDSDGTSYAYQIAGPSTLPLGIVIAEVERYKVTDDAHREVTSSPFFDARIGYVQRCIDEAEAAIRRGDLPRILEMAEHDTLNLHAVTMSGERGMVLWAPNTLRVIETIRLLRDEGVPVWFSIDTGASVYANTYLEFVELVMARIAQLGVSTYACTVGGGARLVTEHMF